MAGSKITRKRNIHACVECRQAKTKCDSVITLQHPCSRCRLRHLECIVDNTFERMPVRQRLRGITAELHQLRESVKSHPASLTASKDPASGHGEIRSADGSQHKPGISGDSTVYASDPVPHVRGRTQRDSDSGRAILGPLDLSVHDVEKSFRIYREHFYQHLPIVDLSSDLGELQQCSPFLFWTILMIVQLRFSPIGDATVKDGFVAEYSSLTKQWLLSAPLTLHDIQAILHLCVWPLPVHWQLNDPSILYTGIVINACGYLNLSRSANKRLYQGAQLSGQHADAMSKTWLAAFSVSTAVAFFMGVSPPIRYSGDLFSLQEHIKRPNAPRQLATEAAILSTLVKHHNLCVSGVETVTHAGLLELHTKELDCIRQQGQAMWNDNLEIQYLFAKVSIFVPFLLQQRQLADTETDYPFLAALEAGKSAVYSMIQIFGRLISPLATDDEYLSQRMFAILPKFYFRAVSQAVFFLLRFGAMSSGSVGYDEETREHIALAQRLLTKASSQTNDEQERSVHLFKRILEARIVFSGHNSGIGAMFWDMLRQSYRLRSWKHNRTNLLHLIDPTGKSPCLSDEAGPSQSDQTQTVDEQPYIANDDCTHFWDESMRDLFDLDLFEMPGIINAEGIE